MNPAYIRLSDKKYHKSIDINNRGTVIVNVTEDGEIIGVEILSKEYKIEIDDEQD